MRRILTRTFWSCVTDLLSLLGGFTVITTITSYFSQLKQVDEVLKSSPALAGILLVAVVWAVLHNWPRSRFEYKLNNKDIRMRLVIGDILKEDASVIVPINDEFDASLSGSVVASNSIKAQVVKRYFGGDCDRLGTTLRERLNDGMYTSARQDGGYTIGTTVSVDQEQRKFYFVANSRKLNKSRVEARKDDLPATLAGLWVHVASYGSKENVAVPLLGTGNGRLSMPREEVFREIVRSFIASCSEKSYCDILTIVVSPQDVEHCEIDVDKLDEFLAFQCRYTEFASDHNARVGTAV